MNYKATNPERQLQQPAEQHSTTREHIDPGILQQRVIQGPLGGDQAQEKEKTEVFPFDTLPAPCRQFIQEAQDAQNLDPAFAGAAVLSVLSTAIGNARELQLKKKRKEHAALFMAVVGRPGSGKTPAHKLVFEPLKDHDDETYKVYQDKQQAYKDWEKSGKEAESEPPEWPVWKRKLVNDHTIEVLADILDRNPRGICLYVDELATWFDSFNRYNSGPDLERWLSIWSHDHFTVDRKNKPPVKISKPFCSVFGGIQPSVLPRLFKDEKGHNGFTDRILFASETPGRPPDKWRTGDIASGTIDAYKERVQQLNALSADEWEDGAIKPDLLFLTENAESLWEHYYNETQQAIHNASEDKAALLSKIEQYVPRLALILALGNDPSAQWVLEDDLQNAIKLGTYFTEQARLVKVRAGASSDELDNKALIKHLASLGNKQAAISQVLGIDKAYISKVLSGAK